MSEQPTSALTRLVPGLTLVTLIVIIAAAAFHVFTLRPPTAPAFSRAKAPKAPAYSDTQSWLARPASAMPGGWSRPWGVDVFWLTGKDQSFAGGWNSPIDWVGNISSTETDKLFIGGLSEDVGVYAPRRRFANELNGPDEDFIAARRLEAEDARAAFDLYIEQDHNLRGFFLGGRGSGVEMVKTIYAERISETRPYENVFGGFIIESQSGSEAMEGLPALPACAGNQLDFPCLHNLEGMDANAAAESVSDLFSSFSAWLDANAPKPASPLPPIETIEIAPIHKPNEP